MDKSSRIISVSLDEEILAKSMIPASQSIAFELLKAGSLVNTKVKAILDNGLQLSFLGYFEGTVDLAHLGKDVKTVEALAERFKVGQKLHSRILYVDPAKKHIGLTLIDHLVKWSPISFGPAESIDIGSIFEEVRVLRVDAGVGLLLAIPGVCDAYVH
ncbi:hypothetical protein BDK51DRAFT_34830, partial [Blyttiomyces helicus]